MTGDRDLLYAVLTQHLGYADATHVVNAGLEWSSRREQGVTMRQLAPVTNVRAVSFRGSLSALTDLTALAQASRPSTSSSSGGRRS